MMTSDGEILAGRLEAAREAIGSEIDKVLEGGVHDALAPAAAWEARAEGLEEELEGERVHIHELEIALNPSPTPPPEGKEVREAEREVVEAAAGG